MIFGRETALKLDVGQAYILWRLLVNRYLFIGHVQQLKNFSHDMDFNIILSGLVKDWRTEVETLEKQIEKYKLRGGEPPAVAQDVPGNSEVVVDKETALVVYSFMRLDIHILMWSLKDNYTNDDLSKILKQFAKQSINRFDKYVKYLKLKNWIDYPPYYPYVKNGLKDSIGTNEVYLLWDHLTYRYGNIRKTQLYMEMTSDNDFKALLFMGRNFLLEQSKEIEKMMLHFGVALPKPYSEIPPIINSDLPVENKFMFNDILRGMQETISNCGSAMQDIILNDKIRHFLVMIILDELELLDKMIKFGKVRGWLNLVPAFSK